MAKSKKQRAFTRVIGKRSLTLAMGKPDEQHRAYTLTSCVRGGCCISHTTKIRVSRQELVWLLGVINDLVYPDGL